MELTEKYKQIRRKKYLRQQDIADILGLSRQSICDFENGRTKSNNILSYYLGIADDEDVQDILDIYRERGNYGNINKIN